MWNSCGLPSQMAVMGIGEVDYRENKDWPYHLKVCFSRSKSNSDEWHWQSRKNNQRTGIKLTL